MNRRDFLQRLLAGGVGAAAALEFDYERLLWVPGAKTIVLPPAGGWAGNTFLTPDWVTREALRVLERNLSFVRQVSREYDVVIRHA
jgi:hypothetical protein